MCPIPQGFPVPIPQGFPAPIPQGKPKSQSSPFLSPPPHAWSPQKVRTGSDYNSGYGCGYIDLQGEKQVPGNGRIPQSNVWISPSSKTTALQSSGSTSLRQSLPYLGLIELTSIHVDCLPLWVGNLLGLF